MWLIGWWPLLVTLETLLLLWCDWYCYCCCYCVVNVIIVVLVVLLLLSRRCYGWTLLLFGVLWHWFDWCLIIEPWPDGVVQLFGGIMIIDRYLIDWLLIELSGVTVIVLFDGIVKGVTGILCYCYCLFVGWWLWYWWLWVLIYADLTVLIIVVGLLIDGDIVICWLLVKTPLPGIIADGVIVGGDCIVVLLMIDGHWLVIVMTLLYCGDRYPTGDDPIITCEAVWRLMVLCCWPGDYCCWWVIPDGDYRYCDPVTDVELWWWPVLVTLWYGDGWRYLWWWPGDIVDLIDWLWPLLLNGDWPVHCCGKLLTCGVLLTLLGYPVGIVDCVDCIIVGIDWLMVTLVVLLLCGGITDLLLLIVDYCWCWLLLIIVIEGIVVGDLNGGVDAVVVTVIYWLLIFDGGVDRWCCWLYCCPLTFIWLPIVLLFPLMIGTLLLGDLVLLIRARYYCHCYCVIVIEPHYEQLYDEERWYDCYCWLIVIVILLTWLMIRFAGIGYYGWLIVVIVLMTLLLMLCGDGIWPIVMILILWWLLLILQWCCRPVLIISDDLIVVGVIAVIGIALLLLVELIDCWRWNPVVVG